LHHVGPENNVVHHAREKGNGTRRSYLGLHLGLPDRSMSKSESALMHLNPITPSPPSLTDSQYLDNDIIGLGLASSLCNSDRVLRYPRCTHTIRLSALKAAASQHLSTFRSQLQIQIPRSYLQLSHSLGLVRLSCIPHLPSPNRNNVQDKLRTLRTSTMTSTRIPAFTDTL